MISGGRSMDKYWSRLARKLEPYVPGEQPGDGSYIKLNTNENPYGPSPKVLEAVRQAVGENLRLYPDPTCGAFISAVAARYGVKRTRYLPATDQMKCWHSRSWRFSIRTGPSCSLI